MTTFGRGRWSAPRTVVALLVMLGGGAGGMLASAAAQAPAAGVGQVIAQGTAWLPAEPAAWWVTPQTAPATLPQSPFRQLGFVLGNGGITEVITEGVLGDQLVWLDPGEALFVPRDTYQDRSTSGLPATYYSLDLLPATIALDPPAFQGSAAFIPAPALHELSLVRDVVGVGELSPLPVTAYPTLILATSGPIAVVQDDGQGVVLESGQTASLAAFTGAEVSAAGNAAVAYVAAVISTRFEQAPVAGVADLGLWVLACPPGVTARPAMEAAGCRFTDPLVSGLEVQISGPALAGPLTLANSGFGDAGARLWAAVPFGTYTLAATLPPGASGYAVRPGTAGLAVDLRSDRTGYTFTIDGSLFDPRGDYQRVNLDVYLLYP